uniref:RNA-binding protein 41 n=1 Tax=Geotrypetes seraphini TaxID=260995 RepID=A0A6P8RI50_GEOSA|nr:RNA-binding protein 41 isoform X4 [Geotrypetes seraphini]
MRRVSSLSSDDLILEDLETEGERQLKTLLHNQLDTTVSFEQCMSKRRCFAPATVYKPFGAEAAGTLSLSQFQILQENDKETASFRELGLTDSEIVLWKQRGSVTKGSGFGAAPEAVQERLKAIEKKISERQRILALPQRFAGSKQLNRREMEIENALFQGTDRHSFLRSLYYQDEVKKAAEKDVDPRYLLDTTYKEIFEKLPAEEPESLKSSFTASGPTLPDTSEACYGRVLYLKNLHPRTTVKELISLFARFQQADGPQIQFRLLTGRMRGQAFITFPSAEVAQKALLLVNGFCLRGKPVVIEFGKNKAESSVHQPCSSALSTMGITEESTNVQS